MQFLGCQPRALRASKGRVTALCSKSVMTTWSPGFKKPLSTTFSAWVQLGWKSTHSGPGAPKNSAACCRTWYTAWVVRKHMP